MLVQIQENKSCLKIFWAWSKMGAASLVKINFILKMNRWSKLIFLHAGTNSEKLKVDSMIFE